MNIPLANAFCTSCSANSRSRSGSAADAITKSTGKSPPPGSAGGVSGITRMPGICDSGPIDSISSCCAVFVRSLHGVVTMPPKPPVGNVIWKMLAASGNER
jgi:hypothetical protein